MRVRGLGGIIRYGTVSLNISFTKLLHDRSLLRQVSVFCSLDNMMRTCMVVYVIHMIKSHFFSPKKTISLLRPSILWILNSILHSNKVLSLSQTHDMKSLIFQTSSLSRHHLSESLILQNNFLDI